jgi:sugar fermentation stimulation protein A
MRIAENLYPAVLVKRYKRFLADVVSANGDSITLHCPNTGSMKNCQESGSKVWYSLSDNAKRKYPGTWQLIEVNAEHLVGINTALANKLVKEAIEKGVIAQLQGYAAIKTEVPYGEQNSRIDLLLENPGHCWIEVKNVSLGLGNGVAEFPDAVTRRGQKHLQELIQVAANGDRAVLLFCVQHSGIDRVRPADTIDPEYGRLLRQAAAQGVEILAYAASFDLANASIALAREVIVEL